MTPAASDTLQIGQEYRGRSYTVSRERILAFSGGPWGAAEWPARNLHTDPAMAAEAGLDAPIASGLQYEGHVIRLLLDTFGDSWSRNGSLSIKYVHPVRAGDIVRSRLKVIELEAGMCRMEVYCEKEGGEPAIAGEATCQLDV